MYDKSAVISSSSILLLLLLVDLINGYALPMATSPWHFNGSTLDFKQSKRVSHPGKRRCRSGLGAPHFTKPNNNSPWYGKTWASAVSYQSPVTQADPVLQIEAGCVYVAWPGVSEVFQWILETGESSAQSEHGKDMTWRLASKTNKGGIETALELPKYRVSHIRVIALDQKGAFLGTTSTVELDQENALIGVDIEKAYADTLPVLLFCVTALCFAIIFAWVVDEIRRYRRVERYSRMLFHKV